MYVTPDKLAESTKASVDALFSLVNAQLGAIEKLANLNLATTRAAIERMNDHVRALTEAKDPQEFVRLNTTVAQPAFERAMDYSKGVYDVAAQTQQTVSRLLETHATEVNKAFLNVLDTIAKNSPAGSDAVVTAMKTALAAVNSAYDSLSKAAKQAAEVVDVNFAAASRVGETVRSAADATASNMTAAASNVTAAAREAAQRAEAQRGEAQRGRAA